NFSDFEVVPYDSFAGEGSFVAFTSNFFSQTDKLIPINPGKTYKLTMVATSDNPEAKHYIGHMCYDKDANPILSQHVLGSQYKSVNLVKDIYPGDTEIHLSDVSQFKDDIRNTENDKEKTHSLVIWNYTDSFGRSYEESYSRYVLIDAWDFESIDRDRNVIHLREGFNLVNPDDPEHAFRAGSHTVSPTKVGDQFRYSLLNNQSIPNSKTEDFGNDWHYLSARIAGTSINGPSSFAPGTYFIKPAFLLNTGNSHGSVSLSDIELFDSSEFEYTKREIIESDELVANIMKSREMNDYKATVTESISKVEQTAEEIRESLERVTTDVVEGTIEDLKAEFSKTAEGLEVMISNLSMSTEENIKEINTSTKVLSGNIETLVTRLNSHKDQLEYLGTSITQNEESIESVATSLKETVEGDLETLKSSLKQMSDQISAVVEEEMKFRDDISNEVKS